MPIDTRWFRDRLADQRMSQRGLARQLGLDAAAVSLMLRGKREMKIAEAAQIARLLGVPADDVMTHAGVRIDSGNTMVPVAAYVDGSGEVHWQDGAEATPHPGGILQSDAMAIECRTAGTPLDHINGWLLFAPDVRHGVQPEAVGRLSLCRLKDGVIYLAAPSRGTHRGRWHLSGPASAAKNVELEWATPVLIIIP
jgi:transcriptional regulator with XRE-family HTH domain